MAKREIIVDTSSYQSGLTPSDFKKIGATKNIVKMTEGTNYVNPYIRQLIDYSAGGGVTGFAGYHFSQFRTVDQAVKEADFFDSVARKYFKPGAGLIDDAEITNMNTESHVAFLKRLKAKGWKVGFYTYKGMMNQFNMKEILKVADLFWIAAYPLANGVPADKNPDFNYFPSADKVDIWQYTDNLLGKNVDGSISLTQNALDFFNPSKEEKSINWKAEKGTFTAKQNLFLRTAPEDGAKRIATIRSGDVISYDAYADLDGYRWLRQPRSDGSYGYLPCRNPEKKYFGKFGK